MSTLITRCPSCGTTFRVQPAQLSMRGGKVRCGKCTAVFDGLAGLVEEGADAPAVGPSPQLALFDPARLAEEEARQAETPEPTAEPAPRPPRRLPPEQVEPPPFLAEPPAPARFRAVWALLSLLALLGLGAQVAYQYRTDLALLVPETRPVLDYACDRLGCRVGLPRRAELMSIESSDLQADPQRADVIQLTAVIRNRATFPQEYPSLELTLTDESDRATVRRVLAPGDYLGAARRAAAASAIAPGIGPGAESLLRVDFEAIGVRATGYRLYLFFP